MLSFLLRSELLHILNLTCFSNTVLNYGHGGKANLNVKKTPERERERDIQTR